MRVIKVLHAHNYGHKNIGDEAMAQNVFNKLVAKGYDVCTISTYEPPIGQDKLKDRVSLSGVVNNYNNIFVKIFLVAVNKFKFKTLYACYVRLLLSLIVLLAKLYKYNLKVPFIFPGLYKFLEEFRTAEVYIRSGSGSLNDIWFWSSLMPQFTEARIAKMFDVKVFFTGQGIGPITGKYRENIMRKFLANIDYMTLRDKQESKAFLDAIGCHDLGNYSATGDDALDLPIEKLAGFPLENKGYIVCQFRETDYENKISRESWDGIAGQIDAVAKKYPKIKFCFISFSNGIINDLNVAKAISEKCNAEIYIVEDVLTPEQAKWVISNSLLAIGQSYHFGVFALSENVPFLGLYTNEYYKLKHAGLLEWYDLENYVINITEKIDLLSKVDHYLENSNSIDLSMSETNKLKRHNINMLLNDLV